MAKILGIQIAGILFGLFMLYYSFLNYKRKEFNAKEFVFWIFLWAALVVIALFPSVLDPVIKPLGFFRALDFLVMTGFLFLTLAIFYTYTVAKKNSKQLESIVREIAIKGRKK
ncbi:DUF2304 domain-containing protein [Candidatus Woesearchaeota archaeon]|nr:DUF2304 domain-containing protein [Candidatus Woesearchaeota archaeon]